MAFKYEDDCFILGRHTDAARVCSHSSSILNKLTPDKFDKLCLELLNVGVDSKLVLKGIILLVRTRTHAQRSDVDV